MPAIKLILNCSLNIKIANRVPNTDSKDKIRPVLCADTYFWEIFCSKKLIKVQIKIRYNIEYEKEM